MELRPTSFATAVGKIFERIENDYSRNQLSKCKYDWKSKARKSYYYRICYFS